MTDRTVFKTVAQHEEVQLRCLSVDFSVHFSLQHESNWIVLVSIKDKLNANLSNHKMLNR